MPTRIEEAGADALELNIYFLATDFETSGQEVEARYIDIVGAVREQISIPLAVKLGPFFTSFPNFAEATGGAGADGFVLFNRFLAARHRSRHHATAPRLALSTPEEMRLSLRWIALLHGRIQGRWRPPRAFIW